ncbi:MAG TPA: nucleotide exchange factor GrpE [Streptosporangiaceae bacterium]
MSSPEETNTGPVIRDLRRIDPVTGRVRDPGKGSGQPGGGQSGAGPAGAGAAGAAGPGGGATPRATGKSRPGKHAASKPGGTPGAEPGAGASGNTGTSGNTWAAGRSGTGQEAGQAGRDSSAGPGPADAGQLADELAERTADLQRMTAEYANYRKRVERDRVAVREQALANVLAGLLPVLDDIGRAREHGELVGGFKSVADSLEAAVAKLGLDSFGEAGEPFDPKIHEALLHSYASDVTEPTCVQILQPGYRVGDRILRPARVAVAEPSDAAGPGDEDEPGDAASDTGAGAPGEPARDAATDDD